MCDDDAQLLTAYAREGSEAAFAALVRRQVNFVYATALRQVNGDAHLAQDVTQLVFTDLARKARALTEHRALAGWLFTSTRYAAAKVVRGEQRRRQREREAMAMNEAKVTEPGNLDWERVRPVLDDALAELKERDRAAILLRFLQGRDFAHVGERLALTDNAARMCVDRALDKLRDRLARRGITSTSTALAAALATQAAIAAPAGLPAAIAGSALTSAAAAGATVAFMSITKMQVGLMSAVVVAGTGTLFVQEKLETQVQVELAARSVVTETDLTRLREENRRLEQVTAQVAAARVTDTDWAKLQSEASALRDRLEADERRRRQEAAAARLRATAVVPMNQLDRSPVPTGPRKTPRYPVELREQGIPGEVVVEFVIDREGRVVEAKVAKSSHPDFEQPALEAVQGWQFQPGVKGGRSVNTRVTQQLRFDPRASAEPPPNWF